MLDLLSHFRPIVYDGKVARDIEEADIARGMFRKSYRASMRASMRVSDYLLPNKTRDISDPPLAMCFAGCQDEQTSADATGLAGVGMSTGGTNFNVARLESLKSIPLAFTYLFLQIVNKNPDISFDGIMQEMRRIMKTKGFPQVRRTLKVV